MPLTLSAAGGDGVTGPAIRCNVQLPDTGTSIPIQGSYQAPLIGSVPQGQQPVVNFSGTETSPGVPGSGSNYWIIELNPSTNTLATKSSTSAIPLPDAGNVVIFQQTIPSTANAAPSLQGGTAFPWL
jgi:hypothetical protein